MVCKIDMCDCNVIHDEIVEAVKEQMPKEKQIEVISNFYKIFSDSTKLIGFSLVFDKYRATNTNKTKAANVDG